MITLTDEKSGLVKTCWTDVRNRVANVEPQFSKIVDKLNPDKSFPLFIAYYPYGAMDADTRSSLFPDGNGAYYRITDKNTPKDLITHLGYSANNTPFGIVLEKQIESFVDLKNQAISIPWRIYTPGKMFPLGGILNKKNKKIHAPNGLVSSVAGSRSTFMLPNIGCAVNHSNLQREFNVRKPTPKVLYEHWNIFKEIVNSGIVSSNWRCCILYFSEKWINKILHDKAWVDLNKYLHEVAWYQFEYEVNRINYDVIFSIIQKNCNLKPNPYLTDTAKHLFSIAIGSKPGYAPAVDDSTMPLDILQKAFSESYGLKKYIPTIMHPVYFNYETDKYPVYYSLQNPSTHIFSPKSREASSTLFEMRELEYIMNIFIEELSDTKSMCANTILGAAVNSIKFSYYHNKNDNHGIISSSSDIPKIDDRFYFTANSNSFREKTFACDSTFLRGCISILGCEN